MDYMHARFYSPQMARFFSVDPVGGDPLQPQSWNRYAYVENNPLKYTDPTGELIATGYAGLKALQDVLRNVGEEELANRLQLVSIPQQHSFLGFKWTTTKTVVSSGDADLSQSSNPVAALIGDAIKTDVTVDFRLTGKDLSEGSGAITKSLYIFNPDRADSKNRISIRINPGQVAQARVPGERGPIGVPLGAAVVHEFGHAHAHFQGRAAPFIDIWRMGPTDPYAVGKENIYREYAGLPRRIRH